VPFRASVNLLLDGKVNKQAILLGFPTRLDIPPNGKGNTTAMLKGRSKDVSPKLALEEEQTWSTA
jgi:hypothetical protein